MYNYQLHRHRIWSRGAITCYGCERREKLTVSSETIIGQETELVPGDPR